MRVQPARFKVSGPTFWGRGLLRLIEYGVSRGLDAAPFYDRLELHPEALTDPDRRVPVVKFHEATEFAAITLDDPYFGMRYIEDVGFAALDTLGFLAAASSTVGEALRRCAHHHTSLSEGESMTFETIGSSAVVRCAHRTPPRLGQAHMTEMYAAGVLMLIPRFTGRPLELRALRFNHTPRGNPEAYKHWLSRVPEFSASDNEWIFGSDVLEHPMPKADPLLASFFDGYMQERFPAAQGAWTTQVQAAIAQSLPDGNLSLRTVAQRLRMQPRTLQRHLAKSGSSFEALLDEVRQVRARAYLDMKLSVAEVSYLIGYAEPRAFHRAFRRWTGMTPLAWRDRHGDRLS